VLVFYPPMTELRKDPVSLFLRLTGFSGLIYKKEDNIDVAYIKRLIGLPGDTVEVKPGVGVFVNGQKLDEPYVNEIANTCTFARPEPICEPVKVPPDSYYMMGDNRNLSLDSRYWGFAQEERVIGRAVFRIWPLNRTGPLQAVPYATEEAAKR
jgi:signal peptidase I